MKLKIVENLSKKFTKTASVEMKKEVKKTAIDLIPGLLAFAGMIAGVLLFREIGSGDSGSSITPTRTISHTTVNNYFFNDVSEETILKMMDLDDMDD